jgi:hypothetical protein
MRVLPEAGGPKSRILLKCQKFSCLLFPGGGGSDVITYLAGHKSLAGAGWAEKQDFLDVLTAKTFLMCRGRFYGCTYLFGGP